MKKGGATSSRLAALALLERVLDSGYNLADADSENQQADARDRAFSRHLAYGVLRWLTALEWLANQLLRKPLRRKDRDVQRLILLGLFQLWKGDSAAHAAIHESAESARKLGKPWAVSVINAVLRRFQREQDELLGRLQSHDERFAHPQWLLQALRVDWPDDWQHMATANNEPGALWLRLNRQFDRAETLDALTAGGYTLECHPVVPEAVRISPAAAVSELPGFDKGRFSVQDPAAQLAAGLLQLEDGQHVLDACAAPGGKSCHILEAAPGVHLTALDQSATRLERVADNMRRLGYQPGEQARLLSADASDPDSWWDGNQFDRILLDAPCTATGVIRRHPEIKWLRKPEQVREAVATQARLLAKLWPLLKPGGMLLYATCSILNAENTKQVAHFIGLHADAELLKMNIGCGKQLDFGQQILPGEQEMDGFFYAGLRKNP
jgi:16S rRNA (cytosine967-C5)-methyltransferase